MRDGFLLAGADELLFFCPVVARPPSPSLTPHRQAAS